MFPCVASGAAVELRQLGDIRASGSYEIGMNLFIDTNILLDFYRLSTGDLEELRKIAKLSSVGKIRLFISDYVKDEYSRNRESVIAAAVEQFRKSRIELQLPNLVRAYSASQELKQIKESFNEKKEMVLENLNEDIQEASLHADSVIKELFESSEIRTVPDEIIKAGIDRSLHSRPPGKRDSYGDAIHWEWLLSISAKGEDFFIVSGDRDYESPLHPGVLSAYLQDEWQKLNASRCILFSSLEAFLMEYFPDIQLADEVDKILAIEQLEKSHNFQTTHNAIKSLGKFDDFKNVEIIRLINSYLTNDQIVRILGDEDVREFGFRLCDLAIAAGISDEVEPLVGMLESLEPTESGSQG